MDGQRHVPPTGPALGDAFDDVSRSQPQALPPDPHDASVEVDIAAPEGEQLTGVDTAEAGDEDQRPVAAVDGVGQAVELGEGDDPLLRVVLDAIAADAARVAHQPLQAAVEGWAADTAGATTALLAWLRANVAELNSRPRVWMAAAGRLTGPEPEVDGIAYLDPTGRPAT